MAKYYIESGDVRMVVQAEDARMAALWTMHSAMEKSISLDEFELSLDQREDLGDFDSVAQFAKTMRVSEIGFGRDEAGVFDSLEMMIEWNQLAVALQRLERIIDNS